MLPSSSIGAQEPIITTLCIRRRHVECPWPSDRHRPSGHKVIEIVSLIFAESLSLNSSDTLRIARTVQSKFYQINHLFMYAAANSKKIGIQLFLCYKTKHPACLKCSNTASSWRVLLLNKKLKPQQDRIFFLVIQSFSEHRLMELCIGVQAHSVLGTGGGGGGLILIAESVV